MVAFSLRRTPRRATTTTTTSSSSSSSKWKVSFLIWSFGIAIVAFYCGVLIGIHAAVSNMSLNGISGGDTAMSIQSILGMGIGTGLFEHHHPQQNQQPQNQQPQSRSQSGRTPEEQQALEREIQWRVNLQLKQERAKANQSTGRQEPRFPSSMAEAFVGAALVDKHMFLDRFDPGIARPSKPQPKNEHVYIIYQKKQALPHVMHDDVSQDGPLPILSVQDATENCESLNVISTRPFSGVKQCIAIVKPTYQTPSH